MSRMVSAIVTLVSPVLHSRNPTTGRPRTARLARGKCEDYTIRVRTINIGLGPEIEAFARVRRMSMDDMANHI